MIDLKVIEQIQQAPAAERILLMELILESLKQDVAGIDQPAAQPFRVRRFNLGREIDTDRDLIYTERGV
jgi:hypothetical protein